MQHHINGAPVQFFFCRTHIVVSTWQLLSCSMSVGKLHSGLEDLPGNTVRITSHVSLLHRLLATWWT